MSFRFEDLADKTVVLTGAAWGIGRGLTPGLLEQGLRLVLIDRDTDQLAENAAALDDGRITWLHGDLADPGDRARLAAEIGGAAPDLWGIIHNAAIDPRRPLEKTDTDFFRDVIATNVEPAVDLTRQLLPGLRAGDGGRIILIGSITFEIGTALLSAYVASKGAIVGLTRSLAHELGPDGITVNCIEPGAITVEKNEHRYTDETRRKLMAGQSIKRTLYPQDLLGLVCLFLSDASDAISGQVVGVDGGFLHPWADVSTQAHMVEE